MATNTSTVNVIDIRSSNNSRVYYVWENGKWSKNVEERSLKSGIDEITTVSQACVAEDVIEDLLNNICRKGVEITTYRRYGTPCGVQVWSKQAKDKGPKRIMTDQVDFELESIRTRAR